MHEVMLESVALLLMILVQLRLHHHSVLSTLLFIIVLEALFTGIRSGCREELFHVHDLVLLRVTWGKTGRLEAWK